MKSRNIEIYLEISKVLSRYSLFCADGTLNPFHSLTHLRKTPEPIDQQSRWLEQLEEFSFTVEHRSGSKLTNADAMSRRPCRQCHMCDKEVESDETKVKGINTITTAPVVDEVDMWASEVLATAQREDMQLKEFYKLKEEFGKERPALEQIEGKDETCKTLWNQWDRIYLQDEVLYRIPWQINEHEEPRKQIIVPMKLRNSLIEMVHTGMTGGHLRFEKTKEQVRRRAYWPGFSKDVLRYCRECEACSRYKRGPAPKQGPLETVDNRERHGEIEYRHHGTSSYQQCGTQIPTDCSRSFLEIGGSFPD